MKKRVTAFVILVLGMALLPGVVASQAQSGFTQSIYNEEIGDKVRITIDPSGYERGANLEVQFGENKNFGYELRGTIKGYENYDEVVLSFNTAAAGTTRQTVTVVEGAKSFEVENETFLKNPPINQYSYVVKLFADGEQRDLARLRLTEGGKPTPIEVQRARNTENKAEIISGGKSVEGVAHRDRGVVKVNAQGTGAFTVNTTDGEKYSKNGEFHKEHNFYARVIANAGTGNEHPVSLEHTSVYKKDGYLFFVIDHSRYQAISSGEQVRFEFVVSPQNSYMSPGEYTKTYNVERPKAGLFTGDDGVTSVSPEFNQRVYGYTNLAEGTQLPVIIKDEDVPVFQRTVVEVGENGRFTANFQFNDVNTTRNAVAQFGNGVAGQTQVHIVQDGSSSPDTPTVTAVSPGQTQITPATQKNTQPPPQTITTRTTSTPAPQQNPTDSPSGLPGPPQPGFTGVGLLVAILVLIGVGVLKER